MTEEPLQRFDSVWDALEDTPEQAKNMHLRCELAIDIRAVIETWQTSQVGSAVRLAVTPARLDDLMRGRIDRFSLDDLVALAERAGLSVRIQTVQSAA